VRTISIGPGAYLDVYDAQDEPPAALAGDGRCWQGDGQRRPALVRTPTSELAFVAVWPEGSHPEGRLDEARLHRDGVVFGEPQDRIGCASCGVAFAHLRIAAPPYLMAVPAFRRHRLLERCPHCGVPAGEAGLSGVLAAVH
jgi:hypothetical protein